MNNHQPSANEPDAPQSPTSICEDRNAGSQQRKDRQRTMTITKTKLALGILAVVLVGATMVAASDGPFSDNPSGTYYHDAVEWAYDNGITTGTSDTTFSPMDPVTRGQNVTFAYRYDQNIVQPIEDNVATLASDLNNSTRVYFARVVADGTIEKTSSEGITVDYDDDNDPGIYTVTLPETAANCAVQSSLGWTAETNEGLTALGNALANAGIMQGGSHTFHVEDEDPNEVTVYTYLDDITNTDPAELTGLSFIVTAYCSDPAFSVIIPGITLIPIFPSP
jgi:hypothetical protein